MQQIYGAARRTLALIAVLFLFSGAVSAQEFRATVSGAVTDPTGAQVPGANITVRETRTGTVNRTVSDSAGQYTIPFLQPGEYQITVDAPGFKTAERSAVTLQSSEHPIINFPLQLGATGETVNVSSDAPLVDQANASVGQVITTAQVEDLPLSGRTPAMLTQLSIGVISTAQPGQVHPFDNNAANSWSIGGTPKQTSEILLDGAPDTIWSGSLAYSPTQDSVQEVSVRAFDTDASFGHTLGGVINQTTKSGTNGLHGSLYEFGQISNLGANSFFNKNKAVPTARPVTHFNQYGLTVGGPVFVPKVFNGRDKLFFFFAWEGLKDSQPLTDLATVPTTAERAGDFSALLAAGCPTGLNNDPTKAAAVCNANPTAGSAFAKPYADPNQLYNPYTAVLSGSSVVRSPILNNNLLSVGTAFSPVALKLLQLLPAANTTGTSAGVNNYINNAPSTDNYNNEFGRVDWNMSSRSHLFMDIRHNILDQVKNNYFGNGTTGSTLHRENWGTALDEVFTLNPTTVMDVRANWTFFDESHGVPSPGYSPADFGLPTSLASNSQFVQLPTITFATSGTSCGNQNSFQCLGSTGSSLTPSTSYQLFGDVVKVLKRNTLKVGIDARQYRVSVENYGASSGNFTFADTYFRPTSGAAAIGFGGDLASFLLGLPTSVTYDQAARADYKSYYYGAFIQDDFHVSDQLTLNLGVRFDKDTPYGEKFGRTVNGFDPTATNAVTAAGAANYAAHPTSVLAANGFNTRGGLTYPSGNGGAPYQVNTNMISPRFGFSLSPAALHGKTVFRGGFGLFVTPANLANLNGVGTYSSTAITDQMGFSSTTSLSGSNNNFLTPALTLSNPFPNGFVAPTGSSLGASTFLGQNISFLAPVQHDPYAERWDLGFQQTLTANTLLEFLYVGNHGVHLPTTARNINATQRQFLSTLPTRDAALNTVYSANTTNPFAGLLPNTSLNSSTVSVGSLLAPYPQFGTITEQNDTVGQSYFNSANVRLEQRMKHGLSIVANYSFSKFIDATTFLNDQDPGPTARISPYDATHHVVVATTYHLPFGKGGAYSFGGSRVMNEIFGGFIVNAIYSFQTGNPLYFSADIPLAAGESLQDIRLNPRQVGGSPATNTAALNTAAFQTASAQQFVYHLRTLPQTIASVRADGINNLDASLLKDFHFSERSYFQLRFETFNALNHTTFAAPAISSASSSTFGTITAQANTPRFVQIGGRLVF